VIDLRSKRYGSGSTERLRKTGQHREIGVKLDTLQPANAKRQKPVVVFEPSEFAFYGSTVAVEGAEAVALTRDVRMLAARRSTGQRLDDRLGNVRATALVPMSQGFQPRRG
jgi:hypothetical protein